MMKHTAPLFDLLPSSALDATRREVAMAAAKLIARDGATYAIARQKALQQVFGHDRAQVSRDWVPDDTMIEQEVQRYNQLFFAESQPARLLQLRHLALEVMLELEEFNPFLTGAVLNGTAGAHDDIVIELFVDNTKEVAITLINRGVQFEVSEAITAGERRAEPIETLSFMRGKEGIHLVLLSPADLRRAARKKTGRANPGALQQLILESQSS